MNPLAPLYRFAAHLRYLRDRNVGRRGEDLAHRYLRARGYTIVARNWRPPQGGGEPAIILTGAVIANAVYDATGVRLFQMPMTPARVSAALAAKV